ncbi:MAG: 50S ribosomal protein L18 [Gammaproteobacteria bacterium]|nr:50S ribosomal protein L18 [Gammaproteobacteria bacterium]MDH5800557.1 50S ribosomal protein L18 [Gammaproteobacteria bacterium]
MDKKSQRIKRAKRSRAKIKELRVFRLSVFKTPMHTYAQIIDPTGSTVVAAAATVEADVKKGLKHTGNKDAAAKVGQLIAERAKAAGVETVAFDRSGFKYHGRIKALADAAREGGLQF